MNAMTELAGVTNGGEAVIDLSQPYRVSFELTGTSDMLMHRWNNEAVDEKAKAAKNSKAKKSDDIESYVYRNDDGMVCLPGEYVRQAIIFAAKFRQDPRSPRKSAMDLYKAGVVSLTDLASLGRDTWDYEDRRRVVVQRAGINRTRPAFKKGWRAEFDFMVLTPEYIEPTDLHAVLTQAGILIGVADFRPTYGRFGVTKYQVITD
ncbi:hypothetical protein [Burkholderia pseudomallei]|uniref:hypothetical protein n=1 Tax=Burkholderia pseudomallei TaxID=28450 RepID=UPI0005DB3FB7|nr:hypothetical protein [Burkholderia pseudomallei]KYZ79022.1 hypothetical protein PTBPS01_03905 [Burkholderia pseudomallei]OMT11826.1 hypothetical protein AQ753_17430 [Burkholderia pseudomallei]OMT15651.1 hypothetical protein AQ754_21935 [Burkholderia pseudomallei]OMT23505.1 hypothetical protein AQ755_14500 [Burkholderia pseudomallei]CAK0036833.1 Uncharacterised protein [Burkholderia pseudomallei]